MTPHGVIDTDALIVGAGPVGLFQAFQLGLLEMQAHIVDSLPQAGGQPVELYPDKPIYDIPAVPVCSGQALADALLCQLRPFRPEFHFSDTVTQIERQADGGLLVGSRRGMRWRTRALFIAAGVGAFEPRRLKVDGLDAFEGSQVFHRAQDFEAANIGAVLVIGDTQQAVERALALSDSPRNTSVTLMHRRDVFQVPAPTLARLREHVALGALHLQIAQPVGVVTDGHRLNGVRVLLSDGREQVQLTDHVEILLGLSPRLGPIADWGLAMERKQIMVDTERFATSEPGIYAVGDVNTYPGKKKLIVCGFHECVLAAYAAAAQLNPGKPIHVEYTTSSTRLHRLLGVDEASDSRSL